LFARCDLEYVWLSGSVRQVDAVELYAAAYGPPYGQPWARRRGEKALVSLAVASGRWAAALLRIIVLALDLAVLLNALDRVHRVLALGVAAGQKGYVFRELLRVEQDDAAQGGADSAHFQQQAEGDEPRNRRAQSLRAAVEPAGQGRACV
jgi:hypothetical protein